MYVQFVFRQRTDGIAKSDSGWNCQGFVNQGPEETTFAQSCSWFELWKNLHWRMCNFIGNNSAIRYEISEFVIFLRSLLFKVHILWEGFKICKKNLQLFFDILRLLIALFYFILIMIIGLPIHHMAWFFFSHFNYVSQK